MSLSDKRSMSDRLRAVHSLRATCYALAAAILVSGCAGGTGFRPLYATGPSGEGVNDKLSQIEIPTIPSRVGQRVRNELIFENNGGALPTGNVYRLEIAIRESLASTLVRTDGDSASQIYSLDAQFRLIRIADKKVVLEGISYGRAGFERFSAIYSNVRAREDAENRAARTVSSDLRSRLAAFLASKPT
jgi:LPS-assembly lipoprotein